MRKYVPARRLSVCVPALRDKIPKEAVPIDPKQQRHISTDGVKTPQNAAETPKPKKKRFSIVKFLLQLIGCLLCVGVMACSVGAVLLSMYVVQVTADDGETLDLDNMKSKQNSIILDTNGEEYDSLTRDENRIWCALGDMPENLQHAVVAVEDKDFYTNKLGFNFKRTVAAALNEFTGQKLLGSKQGASTIEQQLIKNLTKDDEQDAMRKIREIFRAIGICNKYSKETILEGYLNTIPLTGTICGMQAGAKEYFGKDVSELTLAECATLASITKNPTRYNPYTNPQILIARRNHVLALMRNQGYITAEECEAAQNETVRLVESKAAVENSTRTSNNSWYTDAVYAQLKKDFMEKKGLSESEAMDMIFNGGLRVYSNVDPKVQTAVEQMMYNEDDENFPALWIDEEVESWIPLGTEITYDEEGMPVNPPGDHENEAIFGKDDVPVYSDEANNVFKTGKDDTGEYICFYRKTRTQGSCAVLDYNGNIVAVGGGVGEKTVDLGTNRATLPHQTGSTMKPVASYCLALDNKIINYSMPLQDSPIYSKESKQVLDTDRVRALGLPNDRFAAVNLARDDVWREWPTNYHGPGTGKTMLIYDALRQSYNTIAVLVGSMVGEEYMYNFAHDTLGFSYLNTEGDMSLAPLVLGSHSYGVTAVELAGAYAIFNDGTFTTPHYYEIVEDYQGNIVLDNTQFISKTQAIKPETARIMNRMLTNVLKPTGTANGMAPDGEMEAAAKTGTTSDFKDYTFAGMTPYYVTAIWWGYDKPHNMYEHPSGLGKNAKPIQRAWKALMEEVQADLPYKEFYNTENVVEKNFDPATGALVTSGGAVGYYTEDNLPSNDYAYSEEDQYAQAAADAAQAALAAAGG